MGGRNAFLGINRVLSIGGPIVAVGSSSKSLGTVGNPMMSVGSRVGRSMNSSRSYLSRTS